MSTRHMRTFRRTGREPHARRIQTITAAELGEAVRQLVDHVQSGTALPDYCSFEIVRHVQHAHLAALALVAIAVGKPVRTQELAALGGVDTSRIRQLTRANVLKRAAGGEIDPVSARGRATRRGNCGKPRSGKSRTSSVVWRSSARSKGRSAPS